MPVYEDRSASPTQGEIIENHTVVEAEVTKVEEQDSFFIDEETGLKKRQVGFEFTIRGGEFDGKRIWGTTPTTWSTDERCKLRIWAQEVLGCEIPAGVPLDTDDLTGKHCRVVVGLRTNKTTGIQKNFASDVMRSKTPVNSSNSYSEEKF